MNVSKISVNNTSAPAINYKGKFILSENLSKQDVQVVNLINSTKLNKKTNKTFLKKLPFDVLVNKVNDKPELLELMTFYKNFFSNEVDECFLSYIHADGTKVENDIKNFRGAVKWFDYYKKQQFGYNSFWEKLKIQLFFLFRA